MNRFTALFLLFIISITDGRTQKHCNKQIQQKEEFIIGGQELNIEDVPYQCALTVWDERSRKGTFYNSTAGCGCSILNEWFVLTAAHCFHKFAEARMPYVVPNERFWIQISTATNDKARSMSSWQTYYAIDLAVHEDFVFVDYSLHPRADIALVMVNRPIIYLTSGNKYLVSHIPLVDNNAYASGRLDVYVSGYGKTYEGPVIESRLNTKLHGLVMRTVRLQNCQKLWSKYTLVDVICAWIAPYNAQNTCSGDSGGPVVSYNPGYPPVQVGVVSFGYGNCTRGHPGVYTNVYLFRDWIYRKMAQMYQKLQRTSLK